MYRVAESPSIFSGNSSSDDGSDYRSQYLELQPSMIQGYQSEETYRKLRHDWPELRYLPVVDVEPSEGLSHPSSIPLRPDRRYEAGQDLVLLPLTVTPTLDERRGRRSAKDTRVHSNTHGHLLRQSQELSPPEWDQQSRQAADTCTSIYRHKGGLSQPKPASTSSSTFSELDLDAEDRVLLERFLSGSRPPSMLLPSPLPWRKAHPTLPLHPLMHETAPPTTSDDYSPSILSIYPSVQTSSTNLTIEPFDKPFEHESQSTSLEQTQLSVSQRATDSASGSSQGFILPPSHPTSSTVFSTKPKTNGWSCPDPLCHKSFCSKQAAEVHYRGLHLREEPFACPYCHRRFTQRGNRERHARGHSEHPLHGHQRASTEDSDGDAEGSVA